MWILQSFSRDCIPSPLFADFLLGFATFADARAIGYTMGSPYGVMVLMFPNLKIGIWVEGVVPFEFSKFFIRFFMSTKLEWFLLERQFGSYVPSRQKY